MSDVTRFPLHWPAGRPRTQPRQASKFKVRSFAVVRDELLHQLALLRARHVVLSTNLNLRMDGLPLAGQAQPADPGVAVYFDYKGRAVCFACDRWHKIEDNMQAIRHTIEALRGIARWGTGDMVDAAFSGYAQLPTAKVTPAPWWQTLGVSSHTPTADVVAAYRQLALQHHPDRGGSTEVMQGINAAFEAFKKERGL